MVALSVCLLAGLMVVNPSQYLHALPVASAVVRVIDVLLESVTVVLLQTQIYRLPLVTVIAPIALFSYAFLVTTASFIKRLLALRK
jgi:hypothetical protein